MVQIANPFIADTSHYEDQPPAIFKYQKKYCPLSSGVEFIQTKECSMLRGSRRRNAQKQVSLHGSRVSAAIGGGRSVVEVVLAPAEPDTYA